MLVIRLQRTGRSGHAMFRIVVQDSRRSPTSGNIVAHLGNYDPHTKVIKLDKDKAVKFLEHGAQPSTRMIGILKAESVKLPKWVVTTKSTKKNAVRNPEKRRSTAPKDTQKPVEEPKEEVQSVTEDNTQAESSEEVAVEASEVPEASEETATVVEVAPEASEAEKPAEEPVATTEEEPVAVAEAEEPKTDDAEKPAEES